MSSPSLQEIVCCMGQPVAGNPTQYLMEKAFVEAGLDWRYLTLEVSPGALGDAVRGLRAMGFRGANFTIPHKVSVIEFLDELSESARLTGAVNCIHRVGDRLIGENTDGKGFVQSLREIIDPRDKKIVMIGAGGAARAIGVEVGLAGAAEITIVNRSQSRGEQLAELLDDRLEITSRLVVLEGDYEVPEDTDVLINATSIGLSDPAGRVPVTVDALLPTTVVADVVFNPVETRLLREAAERGCRTLDGLGMLVNQAVIGFKIWTNVDANAAVMREALEEFLGV